MTLKWDCAEIQIIGEREVQEDYSRYLSKDGNILCVLADGMGGHAAGEVAAKLAVDTFVNSAVEAGGPWFESFFNAANDANTAIAASSRENPERDGMGCTLIGVDLSDERLRWISIGDSRLMHFSKNDLRRVNADHSMATRLDTLARAGEITEEEARNDPTRHMLLYALTGDQLGTVDFNRKGLPIAEGDIIILASDGIDTLELREIASILNKFADWKASDIGRALVSAVIKCGNPRQDNTSVMVIRATG